jgi:ADP-ribosyl-[dinitrogen reductase] hydrolase
MRDRIEGCAVGAAVGDALGMPLEFAPRRPEGHLVRQMQSGRLSAGTFTDDTEMALALADSLLVHSPLDPADLAQRFVNWYRAGPSDIGVHTAAVLRRIAGGQPWDAAAVAVQAQHLDSAGNGSVMRCWPVALACRGDVGRLQHESRLQSRVTHPPCECVEGSAFLNLAIVQLIDGVSIEEAIARALDLVDLPREARDAIRDAPHCSREELANSGWVRHTLESAVWAMCSTGSFEEAVVQVVNLGRDADTAGAVVGALAGAAYGLSAIPASWCTTLHGEWPLGSAVRWDEARLAALAHRLARLD